MKIVTRYLLKELAVPFLLGIVLFTFVLLFGQFLQLMDLVVNHGVRFGNLILFTLLGIPETFVLTVPMSMVLATLMAYGRLSSDQELIIFRLSGFPLRTLLVPTLILGAVLSLGLLGFREYVAPPLSEYRQQTMTALSQPDPAGIMKPKTYQKFGDFTLYAQDVDGLKLKGVHIEDHRTEPPKDIYSKRGHWEQLDSRYRLILNNGTIYQRGDEPSEYRVLSFRETSLSFKPETPGKSGEEPTYSLSRLWRNTQHARENLKTLKAKQTESSGNSPPEQLERARKLLMQRSLEFHRALSFPMATFFLVLIAAPLGMISKQEGKSAGFSISLVIIFGYYMMVTFAEPLAINGWFSPPAAMWAANFLFGMIGVGLLAKLAWKGE